MRRKIPAGYTRGTPTRFASDNGARATLELRLEAHMKTTLPSHETWLARLTDHSQEERYHSGTARQCIAVARSFLAFLERRRTALADAHRKPSNAT